MRDGNFAINKNNTKKYINDGKEKNRYNCSTNIKKI